METTVLPESSSPIILSVAGESLVVDLPDVEHALFVALGSALAESQSFEFFISTTLAQIASAEGDDQKGRYDELVEHHLSKTLGWLAKHFQDQVGDQEIADLLNRIRKKRNYLVHNILKDYGWPMTTAQEYLACFREITEIRDLFSTTKSLMATRLRETGVHKMYTIKMDPDTGEYSMI
ncbi:MAG TPA: hypothetical protein ENI85_12000 [Deltaproteobacteria bacterium]|nr:hypothetical protein [Deltaproteobacteria bacterium]